MDLQNIINQENTSIIDVREPFELLLGGKAKGAINIPLRSIKNKVAEFQQMSKPIVVYCRSGNRSGQAMAYLQAQGIQEVYNGGSLSEVKALRKADS